MLMLSALATYAHSTMSIYGWYKMSKLAASEKLEAAGVNQSLKHRNEVQVAFVCSPRNQPDTLLENHVTHNSAQNYLKMFKILKLQVATAATCN